MKACLQESIALRLRLEIDRRAALARAEKEFYAHEFIAFNSRRPGYYDPGYKMLLLLASVGIVGPLILLAVNPDLSALPPRMLLVGMFLISMFVVRFCLVHVPITPQFIGGGLLTYPLDAVLKNRIPPRFADDR